jgi:hypothetical protein
VSEYIFSNSGERRHWKWLEQEMAVGPIQRVIQMTSTERAEKIVNDKCTHGRYMMICVPCIADQIEEAQREAYLKGFHEGQEGLFDRGFQAAKEKAKGIATSTCPYCSCHHAIGEMEP